MGRADVAIVQQTMAVYDMVAVPDEAYYLEQYLHWLDPVVSELSGRPARVLDVGSGQGRLSLRLAELLPDAAVVAVDVAPAAIESLRAYAGERGLANVDAHVADSAEFLDACEAGSVDLALFTEVSFWMERRTFERTMAGLARVVRPGGVLAASFRPQFYNLALLTSERDLAGARLVRDRRSGRIRDDAVEYTWHAVGDVEAELASLGFELERLAGIGVLSGIPGDPCVLVRPSALSAEERAALLDLELSLAERYATHGRYVFAVARRAQS